MEFDSMISVAVEVGTGVIGEKICGFTVAVGREAGAEANVGKACVGALTGASASADTDAGVASAVQAVIKRLTIKIRVKTRFIEAKYIGQKLTGAEFS
jgi:hypothetical protein